MVKASAIEKYQPALEKMDAYVSPIPTQDVVEVRGHLHEQTADSFIFVPDKNPHPFGYVDPAAKATGGEAKAGEDEQTFTIAIKDVDRYGRLLPRYGTYYAMYFTVTGLHALHIIGGLVVMLYFLGPGSAMFRRNPEQLSNRVEVTGIFWHFVDLVWITVFPILYLT
jgi:cytochrome c oxidase subunit 3